ncbi:hypothetical protein MHH37_06730 [Solibacillus sp. FSL K6-1781]|uniref:hypothetical protein n=1 Tax=Solibacillus sp. FSL K6-1781 TaxID=2921474 RepID=UPI00315A4162
MHKYIFKTDLKKLEFESIYHIKDMYALDFFGMSFVVFPDAKITINLLQVREIIIDGVSYQLRTYAVQ